MPKPVSGFSKKSKEEKITWLVEQYLAKDSEAESILKKYWNEDEALQSLHEDFIENTLSNFYLPFAIAPNFLINKKLFAIPMALEESSVVAAASNAAKFWLDRGGFKSKVISSEKNGQIHINFYGEQNDISHFFSKVKPTLLDSISSIQNKMKKRGGGLKSLRLINATDKLGGYYQIHASFETLDSMGANFINSCLETMATVFENEAKTYPEFVNSQIFPEVVLSILSNYTPECLVHVEVQCVVADLSTEGIDGIAFAQKFLRAIDIAKVERRRAVTHNKGIMNGIDAVVMATGNDFRAVEAGVHAYASKNGPYSSLTDAKVENGNFSFWMDIPLSLGTVGGLTSLHPLSKLALKILQNPSARELMQIVAVAGLAQNFAAIRSLITTGIQKGHMKMHLMNILNQLNASKPEKERAIHHFNENSISHSEVVNYIDSLRT